MMDYGWRNKEFEAKVLSKEECARLYKVCHNLFLLEQQNKGNSTKIQELREIYQEQLWRSTVLIAVKYAFRYKNHVVSPEDLVAEGYFAFVKSIEKGGYDPEKGAWSTWITNRIRSFQLRAIRQEQWVVRIPEHAQSRGETHCETSFLDNFDMAEESADLEFIEEAITLGEIDFSCLSTIEAYVMKEYFYNQRTLSAIGHDLGVCKERVRQIKESAIKLLRQNYGVAV